MVTILPALRQVREDLAGLLARSHVERVCREIGHRWRGRRFDPYATLHLFRPAPSWKSDRQAIGYSPVRALLDFSHLFLCGILLMAFANKQEPSTRLFLLCNAIPLMATPLTATLVSSSRVMRLILRAGLFRDVLFDASARSCRASGQSQFVIRAQERLR